jgi:Magnesium chelatase, subunit ChlI
MLARLLVTILPHIGLVNASDTTRIHRVAGLTGGRTAFVTMRPCRAPHHTISDVGLIGGGQMPMPGEVSLAHHGILFLDELPEFRRHVVEVLRQPLEEGLTNFLCLGSHRSHGTGRAGGVDAERYGRVRALPSLADAFRLTGDHARSTDEPSSTDKSGVRLRSARPHA